MAEVLFPDDQVLTPRRWLRPAVQWLGVGTAHAVVLVLALHVSPQARQIVGNVIQASLVAPQVKPAPPPPPPPEPPKVKPRRKLPPRAPAPVLAAAPVPEPSPSSFIVRAPPENPAPVDLAPTPPAPPAAPAPPAPPPLVPPSYNAAYLENPPPSYPPMSRRLGEKGRVLLRVFVSADGHADRVEIRTSSGFARLDQAAWDAVAAWRFVPARRGDEQLAAWVLVPIVFVM